MANNTLIRVLEIPPPDRRYCFGGGKQMPFVEVDWFHDTPELGYPSITTNEGEQGLVEMIRDKSYFDEQKSYLVLCPLKTFTINYEADAVAHSDPRPSVGLTGLARYILDAAVSDGARIRFDPEGTEPTTLGGGVLSISGMCTMDTRNWPPAVAELLAEGHIRMVRRAGLSVYYEVTPQGEQHSTSA